MVALICAIDQGTTSTRVLMLDADANICGVSQREHKQYFPSPAWVEHDAMEILAATYACIREALAAATSSSKEAVTVVAVGITNQRETVVMWDRETGLPLYNALVWQDQRGTGLCDRLIANGQEAGVRAKTGLPVFPYFSASKLKWLLDHVDGAREAAEEGRAVAGTIDSFLLWHLTGGEVHATDVSNASRTLLYNIHTLAWDPELCALFDVPMRMLPVVKPSSHIFGVCKPESPLPGVPVGGILGDQQAALFGQTCFDVGDAKNTYGTGCFLLMNTGTTPIASRHGLLTTVAYQIGEEAPVYALEGSVAVAGSVVSWLKDNLKLINSSSEIEPLAASVPDTGGVVFVPAFNGLFAPHWRSDARGTIVGLTGHTRTPHIARAALEAVAFQSKEVLDAMTKDGVDVLGSQAFGARDLRVDGGMTANGLLMKFQADIVRRRVVRPAIAETTALGAAYAAGLAVGLWSSTAQLRAQWKVAASWEPTLPISTVLGMTRQWEAAVNRSLGWTHAGDAGAPSVPGAAVAPAPAAVESAAKPQALPAVAEGTATDGMAPSLWSRVFGGTGGTSESTHGGSVSAALPPSDAALSRGQVFRSAVLLATGVVMGLALHNMISHVRSGDAGGMRMTSGGGAVLAPPKSLAPSPRW